MLLKRDEFYEFAAREFNPILATAIKAIRDDDDLMAFVFHIAS